MTAQLLETSSTLSGSAITEDRAKKRAVSDDFREAEFPTQEGVESQTSSEGALLGGALKEQRFETIGA